MGWEEVLSDLSVNCKAECAAIFDHRGKLLASTKGYASEDNGYRSIILALSDKSQRILKLVVNNEEFLCIRGTSNSLIGTTNSTQVRSPGKKVMVVCKGKRCMILCIGDHIESDTHCSYLREIIRLTESESVCLKEGPCLPIGRRELA